MPLGLSPHSIGYIWLQWHAKRSVFHLKQSARDNVKCTMTRDSCPLVGYQRILNFQVNVQIDEYRVQVNVQIDEY